MGKPTICIGENKDADQLRGNREADFATRIVQFLFYLNPKFEASSSFLCLYRPVCVGPVQKPHCWFSHEAAYTLPKHYTCRKCIVHVVHMFDIRLIITKNNIVLIARDIWYINFLPSRWISLQISLSSGL